MPSVRFRCGAGYCGSRGYGGLRIGEEGEKEYDKGNRRSGGRNKERGADSGCKRKGMERTGRTCLLWTCEKTILTGGGCYKGSFVKFFEENVLSHHCS
jgi:hypothetical protein